MPPLCVCARPRWRRAGALAGEAAFQPGFCRPPPPPPQEGLLFLSPASGSQACGSVGPAARAEGREPRRPLPPAARRGPARPPPPGAARAAGPESAPGCPAAALASFCLAVHFTPRAPACPAGAAGLSLRGRSAPEDEEGGEERRPESSAQLRSAAGKWPAPLAARGTQVLGQEVGQLRAPGLSRWVDASLWIAQCVMTPERGTARGLPGMAVAFQESGIGIGCVPWQFCWAH